MFFVKEYTRSGKVILDEAVRAYSSKADAFGCLQTLENQDKAAGTHYAGKWKVLSVALKSK